MSIRVSAIGVTIAGLVALAPIGARAQRVSADIRIGGGPVGGIIRIGDRPRPRQPVFVERRYDRPSWFRRDYDWDRRPYVVVYYDRDDDCYYDDYRDGLEEVRVFEEGGRYYRYDDYDRYWRDDRRRDVRYDYDGRYDRNNGRDRYQYRQYDRGDWNRWDHRNNGNRHERWDRDKGWKNRDNNDWKHRDHDRQDHDRRGHDNDDRDH